MTTTGDRRVAEPGGKKRFVADCIEDARQRDLARRRGTRGCTFTGYYANSVSWGHCMQVIPTAADPIVGMSASVNCASDNGA